MSARTTSELLFVPSVACPKDSHKAKKPSSCFPERGFPEGTARQSLGEVHLRVTLTCDPPQAFDESVNDMVILEMRGYHGDLSSICPFCDLTVLVDLKFIPPLLQLLATDCAWCFCSFLIRILPATRIGWSVAAPLEPTILTGVRPSGSELARCRSVSCSECDHWLDFTGPRAGGRVSTVCSHCCLVQAVELEFVLPSAPPPGVQVMSAGHSADGLQGELREVGDDEGSVSETSADPDAEEPSLEQLAARAEMLAERASVRSISASSRRTRRVHVESLRLMEETTDALGSKLTAFGLDSGDAGYRMGAFLYSVSATSAQGEVDETNLRRLRDAVEDGWRAAADVRRFSAALVRQCDQLPGMRQLFVASSQLETTVRCDPAVVSAVSLEESGFARLQAITMAELPLRPPDEDYDGRWQERQAVLSQLPAFDISSQAYTILERSRKALGDGKDEFYSVTAAAEAKLTLARTQATEAAADASSLAVAAAEQSTDAAARARAMTNTLAEAQAASTAAAAAAVAAMAAAVAAAATASAATAAVTAAVDRQKQAKDEAATAADLSTAADLRHSRYAMQAAQHEPPSPSALAAAAAAAAVTEAAADAGEGAAAADGEATSAAAVGAEAVTPQAPSTRRSQRKRKAESGFEAGPSRAREDHSPSE
jgi:hypothetical protein